MNLKSMASTVQLDEHILNLPPLEFTVQQQGEQKWRNELRLDGVSGFLSADLEAPNWSSELPESGRFVANDFDIASALRLITLRGADGPARQLYLPTDFSALIHGEMRMRNDAGGYDIQLDNGELRQLTWLPWVNDARLSLSGKTQFNAKGVSTKLSGGVKEGQFHVLGHLAELSSDDLIYGLALEQNADGIRLDDLFFALPPQTTDHGDENPTNSERRPCCTSAEGLSPKVWQNYGRLSMKSILAGEFTTRNQFAHNLQLDGRLRAVIDVFFDGKNTLHTSGQLLPIGVEVDLSGGRVRIENLSGSAKLLPRSWLLRNGQLKPIATKPIQNSTESAP